VDALRIEALGFEAVFYAPHCMQTSENSSYRTYLIIPDRVSFGLP
jgi:hypothetical protein